jgi:ribosomal protein L22
MAKKQNIDDLKKKARDLEEILLGTEKGTINLSEEDVLPKLKAINPLNYDQVKEKSDEKAFDIVESVILMYLPEDFIRSQDYIYQKMEVDKLTISNLLFQMKTAEHAIKKLLEEIDNGSTGARSFEVLSSLQKSKMEIIKHLASFMVTMENNYKNLKYDYYSNNVEHRHELPAHEEIKDVEEETDTRKFRGTKNLMEMVQSYVKEKDKDNGQSESEKSI